MIDSRVQGEYDKCVQNGHGGIVGQQAQIRDFHKEKNLRDSAEGSAVDRSIQLHSTRIKALAPRGAYFFQIIILYRFHGGSRTFVFIQARLHPAPVNVINENCSDWTTTQAYAPYVDVRRDDSIKDICSPESYALNIVYYSQIEQPQGLHFQKWKGQCFQESDQRLFSFIQKETDWQSKVFVKMAGTLFSSTIDPLLIQLRSPLKKICILKCWSKNQTF